MKYLSGVILSLSIVFAFFAGTNAEDKFITDRQTNLPNVVIKTADETVNTSTAMQDDNHLFFSVDANESYEWSIDLIVITDTTADFKYQFTGPASPTQVYYCATKHNSTNIGFAVLATAFSTSQANTSVIADTNFKIRGFLNNGANAGTVKLQWAQNASSTATTVKRGSVLTWRRIGSATTSAKFITEPPATAYQYTAVIKTGDETLNGNNTFQNDDHLSFAVAASGEYQWTAELYVTTTTVADWKYQWTGPGSPSFVRYHSTYQNGTNTNFQGIGTIATAFSTAHGMASEINNVVHMDGYFLNGSNAGTVQLQWAQNANTGVDTKVLKGSTLKWRKLN